MNVHLHDPSAKAPPSDLQTRIELRKRDLMTEIIEAKQNSSRASANVALERARARLSELAHIVRLGVVDERGNVRPGTAIRLDEWIKK